MVLKEQQVLTPEQYLSIERQAETRSEYFNGELFAMAGASREHNQICSNIVISLGTQLSEKPCNIYSSDMRVKIERHNKYTYPDIVISCDKEIFEDENRDVLLNPVVIIEILSDSTEAYDRGLKFFHYKFINSFVEYLLISQKICYVEKFERQENNIWLYSEFHHMEDIVRIKSIDCHISLKEIYRKVSLEEMQIT
jgi:Uma2 family endonuclease